MDSAIKNVTIIVLILTFAFVGYYLFSQKDDLALDTGELGDEELFANVQKYIERRQVLSEIKLDPSFFSDERLLSFVSYSTENQEQEVGRENPFVSVNGANQVTSSIGDSQ